MDYGARFYDPQIGRFAIIDPLAEKNRRWSPYCYTSDDPLNRVDPDGMTDFTLNQQTGAVKQVGEANKEPDRILKTDSKGNVKTKGTFLVRKSEQGKPKVAVGGIEQGILRNGMNLKSNANIIDVGGTNQPSVKGFENFALKLSNYVDKEVGGYYLSNKGTSDISHVYLGGYENNTDQSARSGFNLYKVRPDLFGNVNVNVDFHTHLSRFNDVDRLRPSSLGSDGGDVGHKERQSVSNPSMKFIIITNPESFEY